MINFTNNKKLNIKINILLAAFLEDEFHENVIEAAIKNSDIDIEKLCESLNL